MQSDFADATNHRERRPQLVRSVSRKAAELLERRFETSKCVVDDGSQPANFVMVVRNRQPLVQPLGRNSPRFRRQMVDGRQRAAGKHVAANAGECDDERQTEHEHNQNFAELCSQAVFGSGDSQNDRTPAH